MGVYSIAEATFDACNRPEKTIFCVLFKDKDAENDNKDIEFNNHQIKSLEMTKKLIKSTGSKVFDTLDEISDYLNDQIS